MGYRGTKRDQQESVHTHTVHFTRKYDSSSSSVVFFPESKKVINGVSPTQVMSMPMPVDEKGQADARRNLPPGGRSEGKYFKSFVFTRYK